MPHRPIRHVVFNMSAAGSLRQALDLQAGLPGLRDKRVIGCPDDLGFGPIAHSDDRARAAWMRLIFNDDDDQDGPGYWAGLFAAFWKDACDPSVYPVIWVSRRCVQEYAGFLELIDRLGEAPCDVIDLTEMQINARRDDGTIYRRVAQSFGYVIPKEMIDQSLLQQRRPLALMDRLAYQGLWHKLRGENAPLRIIKDGVLQSAPITYFDDFILSFVEKDWKKSAYVIGNALGHASEHYHQVGDLVLWIRLCALAEAGRIESRGDMSAMRTSAVRRRK